MKTRRAVRLSLAAVTVVVASMTVFLVLSGGQARASSACGDEVASGAVSLFCVKPTTTTTTVPETTTIPPTTTTLPPSTTTVPEETTTTTIPTTTTTLAPTTTSTIPTEVLPTVITTSTTTTAEVGGIEVLPFTGASNGALLGLAVSLLALGTIAVYGARQSRSEE